MYATSSSVRSGRSVSKVTEMGYKALCTNMAMQSVCNSSERTYGKMLSPTYSTYGMHVKKKHY